MSLSPAEEMLPQLLMKLPSLISLPIENNYHYDISIKYVLFAANNYQIALGFIVSYALFIIIGQMIMKRSAKGYDLRLTLALWNAALSLFSFIGMYKTVPYLVGMIMSQPFEDTVCTDPGTTWGVGPTGLWVMLFIYSKVPELIDTVFIVLRKRSLIFLHWYHHITVLLFSWNSFATLSGSGLYFVAMNYTVHSIMYGYFCLQALKMVPKSFPAELITIAQILQMLVGSGVCISCWYYSLTGKSCHNDPSNLIAGALLYGSYLYLFADFAVRKYLFSKPKVMKKLE